MTRPRTKRPHGSILAVGGGEEKFDKPDILERFVAEAGGADARIAILPTASAIPAERALFYSTSCCRLSPIARLWPRG